MDTIAHSQITENEIFRILVVDDNLQNVELLEAILSFHGYERSIAVRIRGLVKDL
jgi:CheY-like chemotaxis protein